MAENKELWEKVRLTISIPLWMRTAIKKEIAPSSMSQNDFISGVIKEKLLSLGYSLPQEFDNLADLVEHHFDLLKSQKFDVEELESIKQGGNCSEITLLRIAIALNFSEEEIRQLAANQPIAQKTAASQL